MKITVINGEMSAKEQEQYAEHIQRNNPNLTIDELTLKICGDGYVEMSYTFEPVPFERIRRITGYLVGTTDRFNNAKRAEERDRVKHMKVEG